MFSIKNRKLGVSMALHQLHNFGDGFTFLNSNNFVKRFDANSYLYITKAIDYFNILNGKRLADTFKGLKAKVLVIAFKSSYICQRGTLNSLRVSVFI